MAGQLIKGEDFESLHLGGLLPAANRAFPAFGSGVVSLVEPRLWLMLAQTAVALLVTVAGAHSFVTEIEFFSADELAIPAALSVLLLAPLATASPEKSMSVI